MMKFFSIILLQLLSMNYCYSQTHNIVGVFPTLNLKYDLSEKISVESYSFLSVLPIEKTIDNVEYPSHSGALYSELDFTYKVNSKFSLTGSYTYERVNPFENNYRNENRIWLQGTLESKFKNWKVKNRIRYDLRFINNRSTNETDFNPRARYLFGLSKPLRVKENSPVFSIYNEVFFNTFKDASAFYGENWFFSGIGFSLTRQTKIEVGYLNIAWVRDQSKNWLMQHFGQVTLTIDLTKAKKE